jgi:hypothetical protein
LAKDDGVDHSKMRVLVLASQPDSVKNSVSFLNRRDIPTQVVDDLNEALERISRKEVDLLLLSVNYPHPKVELFPTLLLQNFNLECLVFAEYADRKANQILQSSRAKNVLLGQPSGPVLRMRIRQIQKQIETELKAPRKEYNLPSYGSDKKKDQDDVVISGAGLSGGTSVLKGERRLQESNSLSDLLNELNSPLAAGSTASGKTSSSAQGKEAAGAMNAKMNGAPTTEGSIAQSGQASSASMKPDGGRGLTPRSASPAQKKSSSDQPTGHMGLSLEKNGPVPPGKPQSAKNKHPEITQHDPSQKKMTMSDQAKEHDLLRDPQYDLSLLKSAEAALRDVCGRKHQIVEDLPNISRLSLVIVKSDRVKGSFISSAWSPNREVDSVVRTLQERLLFHLNDHRMDIKNSDILVLPLEAKDFPMSILQNSEFQAINCNEEIYASVSYVTESDLLPSLERAVQNMWMVKLEHLIPELPVPCDVFIHMPTNQKILRYWKKGGLVSPMQIDRLKLLKTPDLLIQQNHLQSFQKYFVRNTLLEETERLRSKRKAS